MNTQLVEIHPRELKFIFEVKKQSSCAVHLTNLTDQYVAFKVKTTSPKKYCVRPNVGVIKPKSTHDFTVTMQAQKSAPSDMQCKDKFLIQSTMVEYGTTEEDITASMFSRDSGKYIEETKLRVVLTSAPNSPVLMPVHGDVKQDSYENVIAEEPHSPVIAKEPHSPVIAKEPRSPVSFPVNGVLNQELSHETLMLRDNLQIADENFRKPDTLEKKMEPIGNRRNIEESRALKPESIKSAAINGEDSKQGKDAEEIKLKLTKDIEELKSKIFAMDSKLVEAEHTILKLKEERDNTIREREKLKQELTMSRTKGGGRKVQVGFPPLFVCMVALVSLMIGVWLRR